MKQPKTNALRYLDTLGIPYKIFSYDVDDGKIDGVSVCKKIDEDPLRFFKTLVTIDKKSEVFVFLVPVLEELDLKKASKVVKEKNLQLLPVKELFSITGYQRGGCSPIALKKKFKIYVDSSIEDISTIIISGGKIGIVIEIKVEDFLEVTKAEVDSLTL